MKFWNANKTLLVVIAFMVIVGLILGFSGLDIQSVYESEDFIHLNDGWTIEIGADTITDANLEKTNIHVINLGEAVTISHPLEDYGFISTCLNFYSEHALVDVYLDDEQIYSYGRDMVDTQNSIPKKYHYISLGEDYSGKMLKIVLTGGRNVAFSNLYSVHIGSRSALLSHYISTVRYMMVVGIFMFTMGLLLIVLSPFLFLYHNRDLRIFFSGLISLALGTYILAYYGVWDMLIDNSLVNTVVEYAAMYNIPTVIVGYFMSVFTGKRKKIFKGLFIFDILLFLCYLLLHFSHLGRFSDHEILLHIASISEFVFIAIIIGFTYSSNSKELLSRLHFADNVFIVGVFSFMILSLFDISRSIFFKYGTAIRKPYTELLFFSIGSLVFVSCLLVSYLLYNISSANMANMQSKIANLAYTDQLTGLSNRARCEEMMNMLSESRSSYTIISLDLNKLKQVNDTYGHHEGDRLITGFSTILSDCFWDANLIGRMGGDEFIVILLEDRALHVTKRLHELYGLINEWNRKEQLFKYSVSYGYAYSYEVPNGSANEVYMLADNRMYEMKREHQNSQEVMWDA